jgi:hypothetical protein
VIIGGTSGVDGNVISGNGAGVVIGLPEPPRANGAPGGGPPGPASAAVLRNSISANDTLGIEIIPIAGPNPNDPDDADTGSNGLQNAPTLTSVIAGSTLVAGTLDSTPNRTFRLEFFVSGACDATGFGEGAVFGFSAQVTTDGDGEIDFAVLSPATGQAGTQITATATDTTTNETSEFSNCEAVATAGSATPTPIGQTPTPTPIPAETPEPSAVITDEPTPVPTPTPTPTATASPPPSGSQTATPTPSGPTPSASPTPTGSPELRQGDVDCSGQVDGRDALLLVGDEAGAAVSQFTPCPSLGSGDPPFGDVDCDGDVDIGDAIAVLLWLADLPVEQATGCTEIGELFDV